MELESYFTLNENSVLNHVLLWNTHEAFIKEVFIRHEKCTQAKKCTAFTSRSENLKNQTKPPLMTLPVYKNFEFFWISPQVPKKLVCVREQTKNPLSQTSKTQSLYLQDTLHAHSTETEGHKPHRHCQFHWKNFYASLYNLNTPAATSNPDLNQISHFHDSLKLPALIADQIAELNTPFSETEILKAISWLSSQGQMATATNTLNLCGRPSTILMQIIQSYYADRRHSKGVLRSPHSHHPETG